MKIQAVSIDCFFTSCQKCPQQIIAIICNVIIDTQSRVDFTKDYNSRSHLESPLAPEGDPDVVSVGDGGLVQEDPGRPRPWLWTEPVPRRERHVGHVTRRETRGTWRAPGVAACPGSQAAEHAKSQH